MSASEKRLNKIQMQKGLSIKKYGRDVTICANPSP